MATPVEAVYIVNNCDGCRRGQPLNQAGLHFSPDAERARHDAIQIVGHGRGIPDLDVSRCTRERYLPAWMLAWQKVEYRQVLGTIAYLRNRGLDEAADVLTEVRMMQPMQPFRKDRP